MAESNVSPSRAFRALDASGPDLVALRAEMLERIGESCDGAATPESCRAGVVEMLRAALDQGHAVARARLEAGGRGFACACFLSELEDEVIHALYHYVVGHVHVTEKPTFGERLTLVAVGGYGRGALAPGSDIDLLFLLPYKQTPWGESVVEAMLYMMWDLRQKVGHATRSVAECLRQAKGDMTIRTTLLEARFILGDRELFDELLEAIRAFSLSHEFDDDVCIVGMEFAGKPPVKS